jgi:hypothetical protein
METSYWLKGIGPTLRRGRKVSRYPNQKRGGWEAAAQGPKIAAMNLQPFLP